MSNWYVLISGLRKPDRTISLGSGVSLIPLEKRLSVFDLAAAGAAGFREWAVLEPIASGCECEIETALDAATLPGADALGRAWLLSSLLVLRGFTKQLGVACNHYSWNRIAGHQPSSPDEFKEQAKKGLPPPPQLPEFKGNTLDFHLYFLTHQSPRIDSLTDSDIKWLRENLERANKLISESESFRLALQAAGDWRFTKDARTAMARIWSGIEAIFGATTELVFRLALYCAALLESRGKQRVTRFREFKRLYGIRSKAVHGEQVDQDLLDRSVSDSFLLLRDLLVLTIERGHALNEKDFENAVFG